MLIGRQNGGVQAKADGENRTLVVDPLDFRSGILLKNMVIGCCVKWKIKWLPETCIVEVRLVIGLIERVRN